MNDLLTEKSVSSPKISIGIVVYNGVEHIRNVLDSIVNQSYKNIELIIVDGGSEDGTQNVLREYAEHIAVQVSEPDKGIYDAMNKVCSLATGDWLIFLGCDDVLLDALGNISEHMSDANAVYYGDVIIRSSGKIYGGKFSKFRMMEHNICHQTLFYPSAVYKKHSYSLKYRWLADYVYNLGLMGMGIRFIYTGVVVSIFNDKGLSSLGDVDLKRDHVRLIASTLGRFYAIVEISRRSYKKLILENYYRFARPAIKILVLYPLWRNQWMQFRNRMKR